MNLFIKQYLLLASIGLIWGSQFYYNHLVLQIIPPIMTAALRIVIGATTLSIIGLTQISNNKFNFKLIILYFLIAIFEVVIPIIAMNKGQELVSSSLTSILMATTPIFAIMASAILNLEKFSLGNIVAITLGFTGIIIIIYPSLRGVGLTHEVMGQILILLASLSFAISLILLKLLPTGNEIIHVRNILIIGAITMIIMVFIMEKPLEVKINRLALIYLIVLGALCSGIVYWLYMLLLSSAGPIFTSLVSYLIPLVGVFFGIVFLNEKMTSTKGIGLIIILLSLLIPRLRLSNFYSTKDSA